MDIQAYSLVHSEIFVEKDEFVRSNESRKERNGDGLCNQGSHFA
jgi:hypothetical protein